MPLPESITSTAYHASNGELAWRRTDLPAAMTALTTLGYAILGGEVWVAVGQGRWHGLIPNSNGESGVWHWDTSTRAHKEDWMAYCIRTAEESTQVVAAMRVEEECDPAVRGRLVFNITFVSEADL